MEGKRKNKDVLAISVFAERQAMWSGGGVSTCGSSYRYSDRIATALH